MAKGPSKSNSTTPPRPEAIVVFVDIRGFSQWSQDIDAYERTLPLVQAFEGILRKEFSEFSFKALGDGAMLVKETTAETHPAINRELRIVIAGAKRVETAFKKLNDSIATASGNPTDMDLGWGVTRGRVIKQGSGQSADYLGHHVNKAARLCDLARPNGMVIDRDDFHDKPTGYRSEFFTQVKKLQKPLEEVRVWVSAEINATFQTREKLRETPEVHVAGTCLRQGKDGFEILLAKRSADRKLFPGKWEGCGGQLRYSESFRDGVRRHFRAEMQIDVSIVSDVPPEIYEIEKADEPLIPGLRFICFYVSGEPSSPNHENVMWVDEASFSAMAESEFPPGLKSQTLALIGRLRGLPTSQAA